MKKLALALFSLMLTGSSYAMDKTPIDLDVDGFTCNVTGAEIERSGNTIVKLTIPTVAIEFCCLSGRVNAPEVYIETEEGTEDYVLKYITITTDHLQINDLKYKAHGPFIQKNVPTTNPLSHTSGRSTK